MGAYLMMFAAWGVGLPLPILNLVAAIIYHFVNRKNSRFAAFHSLQSVLSQIPVTAINAFLVGWTIRNVVRESQFTRAFFAYLIFMIVVNIAYVTISIVAMVRARKGRFFYMPIFGRYAFDRYYGAGASTYDKPIPPNKPPEGF